MSGTGWREAVREGDARVTVWKIHPGLATPKRPGPAEAGPGSSLVGGIPYRSSSSAEAERSSGFRLPAWLSLPSSASRPGNAAIVRSLYAAFRRLAANGEVAAYVVRHFDPICEYWPVEEVSPIRGHDALIGWIERWLEAWDDAWDVVEEMIEDGVVVVAATRVYGRGRRSGMELSQRLFDVFELREGKVLR